MANEWHDKYKPTKLEETCLSMKTINLMRKWIREFKTINRPLFLHGSTGIGKTVIARLLLEENGYMNFIHPPGWKRFYSEENKSVTGIILNKFRKLQLLFLKTNLDIKHFPDVDYYVLQKSEKSYPLQSG